MRKIIQTRPYETPQGVLRTIGESDEEAITSLLEGRKVVEVDEDHMLLDNGIVVKVVPNEGGCSCSAGDYYLESLNRVDNIITKVEFDYHPDDDYSYGKDTEWGRCEHGGTSGGHYRIFVLAGHERINLIDVQGSDGNGYYGTGFHLLVSLDT